MLVSAKRVSGVLRDKAQFTLLPLVTESSSHALVAGRTLLCSMWMRRVGTISLDWLTSVSNPQRAVCTWGATRWLLVEEQDGKRTRGSLGEKAETSHESGGPSMWL